jgi:glycosyltransferase involved in cell wall biosynthesis
MSRHIGKSDISAVQAISALATNLNCDVLHGHGAKGGAYARLARAPQALRVYTPHGGSLHYTRRSPVGLMYLALEQVLIRRTGLFLFESAYGRETFHERIGDTSGHSRVVHNGVTPAEFEPVAASPDATDLLFIGELRALKGIDILIDAMKILANGGQALTLTVVGHGPDETALRSHAANAGVADRIHFAGAQPARMAFARGRLLVVSSRAESLPYIVLEAAAAAVPLLATRVGGIGEIYGPDAPALVTPGSPEALAAAITSALADPDALSARTERLRERVRTHFSTATMVEQVLAAYRSASAGRST